MSKQHALINTNGGGEPAMLPAAAVQAEAGGMLAVIERVAMNPEVDIVKMQALLEMQERIMSKKAEVAFNAGFAEMQSEMPTITERGQIRHSGKLITNYALFEDINDQIKPVLQRHGFAVTFKTQTGDGTIIVTGILMHREGHREITEMILPSDTSGAKNSVQSIGSSVSYAKRYALCALLNITTRGEDNDGSGPVEKITETQAADLRALAEEVGANMVQFCKYLQVEKLEDLRTTQYQNALKGLEMKRKR